jgi:acyl-CoA thioesterase
VTSEPAGASEPGGIGTAFPVVVDAGWSIGTRPNGGYLMALVARAAVAASPHPDVLTITAHFLRPPSFGAATVDVDTVRSGRTVAVQRARLIEAGQPVLEAVVTSGTLPADEPTWLGDPAPDLPPPDDCPRARPNAPDGTRIELYEHLEVRYDRETVRWARDPGPHEPVLRAWLRPVAGSVDPYAVLVAADALPPAVFALGARGWAPTVEMTTYLRGRPVSGWLRVAARTHLLAGGWFDEEATVWDAAGRLVAQSRQLALVGR